jgi:uncharacterized iron-regulated membrane protein
MTPAFNEARLHEAKDNAGIGPTLYRTIWRWHFYAGLFCIPFIIILALSGTLYLYKPQIEAAFDAPYDNLVLTGPSKAPSVLAVAALASLPDAKLSAYELPTKPNAAARFTVRSEGKKWRVFVHPETGEVLKKIRNQDQFMSVVRNIHGKLLLGKNGSLLVELAASWAIVMVATGLYLWWPRGNRSVAGILYPRFSGGKRQFWRDMHAVTGFWVSGFALILLFSGLPWTDVWGDAFKSVREATGTASYKQDWDKPSARDQSFVPPMREPSSPIGRLTLDDAVAKARWLGITPPVEISPPSDRENAWVARSVSQNRTLGSMVAFSPVNGEIIAQERYATRHPIDKVVSVGVSLHEGALFGWLNQLLGTLTALGLIILSVSAFILWRKRAPDGALGAPPAIPNARIGVGLMLMILAFALFLPVLGISLVAIALVERLILTRWPAARTWLGLPSPNKSFATQS